MYKKDIKAIEETVLLERECGHIICDFDDREHDLREIAEIIGVDYYIPCDSKITFFKEKDKLRVEEALEYYYDLGDKDTATKAIDLMKEDFADLENIKQDGQYVKLTFKDDLYKELGLDELKNIYKEFKELKKPEVK